MNEQVVKVLKEQMWFLGTYSDEPNVVPVLFKGVTDDGKLVVADNFMKKTLDNIKANGKIAVSVCDIAAKEGYQVKGTVEYVTDGPIYDMFQKQVEQVFKGAVKAKGALIITPTKIFVTSPGPDNNKELPL